MKKFLALALAVVLAVSVLAGCAGGLKDGTYKAEAAEASHGWKDYLVVTVSGGEITEIEFDSLDENGNKKSVDPEYRGNMEPVSGTYPEKFFPDIVNEFTAKGSVDKMDNITGATHSTDSFKALMTAALNNAKKGVTDVAIVTAE